MPVLSARLFEIVPSYGHRFIKAALAGDADAAESLVAAAPSRDRGKIAILFWINGAPITSYRAVLSAVWDHDHRLLTCMSKRDLRVMFKDASFRVPDQFCNRVQLWRGTSGLSVNQARRGLSWTTDRDVACWFAMRFADQNGTPLVLTTTVKPERILYFSDARKEAETVVFAVRKAVIDGERNDWQVGHDRYEFTKNARHRSR